MTDSKQLFNYDATADLAIQEIGVETKNDNVSVHDITFKAADQTIKAYLVIPPGSGPFPGILWTHWLGEPETTNRTQFLQEAVALASNGIVSLLVDAMWSTPDWYRNRTLEDDYANSIRQVVALRRAMDLLTSRPNVDITRIAFVGHDYGAMYGMIAAGVDGRAKAYVFLAAVPSLSDWAFYGKQPLSKADYIRQNAVLELTDYLRAIKNANILFQFAKEDIYISYMQSQVLFRAASEPRTLKMYDADHSMDKPEIRSERDEWLLQQLT